MDSESDNESKSSEIYVIQDDLSESVLESESESESKYEFNEEMSKWEIEDAFMNNTIDDNLDILSYSPYAFLMYYAFENSRNDLIDYIYELQYNNSDIASILEHAVKNNYTQVIEYILSKVNVYDILYKYVSKNNLKMVKMILSNEIVNNNILEEAIIHHNIPMIRYIIRYADPYWLPSQQEIATLLCYYGDIVSILILVPKVVNERALVQMIYDAHESERIRSYLKMILKFNSLHLYYKL